MRHFHDLYAMKHCHMANGYPRRKIPKFPDGGASVPRRGGGAPPVAPRLPRECIAFLSVTECDGTL